ncbi:MAG: PfkB family carbohydrate kinase [Fimbriimonadaceae bacterium]
MANRVWVLGSAVVDFVSTIDRFPAPGESRIAKSVERFLGGKGVNQAVAAARSGAEVSFVGALGLDDAASDFRVLLAEEGIDASEVQTILEESTGQATILVNEDAENMIAIYPGANMMMGASALSHLKIDEEDVVVASWKSRRKYILTAFDLAKSRGQ